MVPDDTQNTEKQTHGNKEIDYAVLLQAARLRILNNMTWEAVADQVGYSRKALYNHREDEAWQEAKDKVQKKIEDEIAPLAWACLGREIRNGSVRAAVEALDRTEGTVAEKLEHTGKDGGPIEERHEVALTGDSLERSIEQLLARGEEDDS